MQKHFLKYYKIKKAEAKATQAEAAASEADDRSTQTGANATKLVNQVVTTHDVKLICCA